MTLESYLTFGAVAIIGMAFHTGLKLKGLKDKAKLANVEFKIGGYFKDDWLSIGLALLAITLCLFWIDNLLRWQPQLENLAEILFGTVGYSGSDIVSRIFGVTNKKINIAIDHKTTVADRSTGDLDTPTALPKTG